MARYVVKLAKNAGIIILFVLAAFLGTISGVLFAFAGDLPGDLCARRLRAEHHHARLCARGELVGEFSTQRRVVVPYEAISPKLRQAIIAAEDADFERHFGLSVPHIFMAATRDVVGHVRGAITGKYSRPRGASTITQQLARGLFPETVGFEIGDISPERKIKEAIVAVQIEKRYTKNEIFTFYANQMYLGEGAYGVEAAARTYFGKSAKDVTLDEAATLAGILQTWRNAPTANMERAKRRQAYVLQQMTTGSSLSRRPTRPRRGRSCWRPPSRSRPASRRTSWRRCARSSRASTARRRSTRTA